MAAVTTTAPEVLVAEAMTGRIAWVEPEAFVVWNDELFRTTLFETDATGAWRIMAINTDGRFEWVEADAVGALVTDTDVLATIAELTAPTLAVAA